MKNNSLKWGLGAIVFLAVMYGLFVYLPNELSPTKDSTLFTVTDEWIRGPEDAAITIIEYSDFQCPACGQYYPVLKQLKEEFPNDLRVVYRHFPLRQIHINADISARASEAAGQQGKFWEMHDAIFEAQQEWSNVADPTEIFTGYALQIGIEKEAFLESLNSSTTAAAVSADEATGRSLAVQGTPTFFMNGEKLTNPRSFEDFKKIIEETLNSQQ